MVRGLAITWSTMACVLLNMMMGCGCGDACSCSKRSLVRRSPVFGIIMFNNTQAMVDQVIANPLTMIASDGVPGHPRNTGTFGRIFAQYVRERRSLALMDAVRKMSYMPAIRLERSTPEARKKGRVQVGADADLVILDPETFRDQSTFEKP